MKRTNIHRVLVLVLLLAVTAAGAAAGPASAAVMDLHYIKVNMTGAAEAPGPGDPDGFGTAYFEFSPSRGRLCFKLVVDQIAPATAAHIHRAPAGSPGPVVIPLNAPTDGFSKGCRDVAPELIKEILEFPARFYVNVHNAEFPAGAVRGQLGD